jgi:iron complex outermembrane receptor protein
LEDDYKAGQMSLYAIYEQNPQDTLTLTAGSGVLDGGFPRTPLGGFGWRRNPGAQASYVSGKWSHRIEKDNTLDLTAYVNDFYGSPGVPQIDYRYQQFAFQLGHSFRPSENHTFSWGVDTRADMLDASNSDPQMLSRSFVSTGILGIYAQDEWRFAPDWSLNLGGRLDYEFYGGFQPSARASLVRKLSDTSQVYAAVSRAFQMPPVGLRFLDMPLLNGLAWAEGHRDLDAETLLAYELGYRTQLFNRLQLGLNVFWHEYDDSTTLSPRLGPPGLLTMDLDNRAAASLYGVELEARYPVSKKLTLLANYTFQEFDWRASVPFHDKELMSPPKNKAMIGVRYSATDDLHLSSHLYYVDAVTAPNVDFPFIARNIDPYVRWDLRAEYEFWKDDASFAVGVRNLGDDSHGEGGTLFLNYAEVPSMVYAEFRVKIRPR